MQLPSPLPFQTILFPATGAIAGAFALSKLFLKLSGKTPATNAGEPAHQPFDDPKKLAELIGPLVKEFLEESDKEMSGWNQATLNYLEANWHGDGIVINFEFDPSLHPRGPDGRYIDKADVPTYKQLHTLGTSGQTDPAKIAESISHMDSQALTDLASQFGLAPTDMNDAKAKWAKVIENFNKGRTAAPAKPVDVDPATLGTKPASVVPDLKKQARDAIEKSQALVKKGAFDAKTIAKLSKASDYSALKTLMDELDRVFYPGPSSQTPGQSIEPMKGVFADKFSEETGINLQKNAQILQGPGPTPGDEFKKAYTIAHEIQKAAIADPYYKKITSAYRSVFRKLMATGNPYAQGYDLFYG